MITLIQRSLSGLFAGERGVDSTTAPIPSRVMLGWRTIEGCDACGAACCSYRLLSDGQVERGCEQPALPCNYDSEF